MLTTLLMTSVLFAPAAPAPAPPAAKEAPAAEAGPAGLPPRIMELKPDADGKIMVPVMRQVQNRVGAPGAAPGPAGPAARPNVIMIGRRIENVELASVKDLKITTAAGKEVKTEDAVKALAKGGMVVVSADGNKVSRAYLKMFKDEVLVLCAPELAAVPQRGGIGGGGVRIGGGAGGLPPTIVPLTPAPAPAPAPNK